MKKAYLFLVLAVLLGGCSSKVAMRSLSAEEQFRVAKEKYQKKKYEEARTEFYKLIFNYPGVSFIDSAQFCLAMCYYGQEEFSLAEAEFKKLLGSFPSSELADDAEYFIPLCNYRLSLRPTLDQENTQLAIDGFSNFLNYYPGSPYVPRAERYLIQAQEKIAEKTYRNGYLYARLERYDAALIYLNEVLDKYHASKWAGRSLFLMAEILQKQGEIGKALEKYKQLLEDFPNETSAKQAKKRIEKLEGKS